MKYLMRVVGDVQTNISPSNISLIMHLPKKVVRLLFATQLV